jgi:uncharacterized protein YjiS (DUF1127 family)
MSKIINEMYSWLKRQEKLRNAIRELSNLTDTELSDIGISRCDIPRVAKEGKL